MCQCSRVVPEIDSVREEDKDGHEVPSARNWNNKLLLNSENTAATLVDKFAR